MLRTILFKRIHVVTKLLLPLFYTGMAALSGSALAAVSQTPLFLVIPAKPNIMFTLDNSGSMSWSSVTGYDATGEYNSARDRKAFYSSAYNQVYYNPATTYTPGVDYLGNSMGNSAVLGARTDPYPTKNGSTATLNLTPVCYTQSTFSLPLSNSNCSATQTGSYTNKVARYAFYYVWDGTTNIKTANPSDAAFPTRKDIYTGSGSYPKVAGATSRLDCGTGSSCNGDQEMQNFANWYSYYRTRILMTKSSIGAAFSPIDPIVSPVNAPLFRVGLNTINAQDSSGNVTYNNSDVADSPSWLTIREFDTAQKQSFYSKLYAITPSQGTPLRTQMDRIGKLYAKTLSNFDYTNNDPYRASASDAQLLSCRASYHIMSTDGYWNDSFTGVGDQDGAAGTYVSQASGTLDAKKTGDTLADVAMYYYKTDLRTNLDDNLPGSTNDPVKFQHMRTFTIGLGANGNLTYKSDYDTSSTGDFAAIKADTKDWGVPAADQASTIDDLWHAAVNGRGRYFSAGNPADLKDGLVKILKEIGTQNGAAASVATKGNNVDGNNVVYAPSFESKHWSGHLLSVGLENNGNEKVIPNWDAATLIPAWGSRNIVTWNPVSKSAVAFTWANLTTGTNSQQAALGSVDVLDYLKGNRSKEQATETAATGYRYRLSTLGDIVNSAPIFAKDEDFGYAGLTSIGAAYSTYLDTKASRQGMLYAGANDGMLHAFNADTGVETFAYIPNSVFGNLKSLSDQNYSHKYFVDGDLTVGDYHNGTSWKTVLLGSTGAGLGSSIFALDISSPTSLGTSSVMWEKTAADAGLGNLGNVMGQMAVGRLPSGDSVILVPNGHDSQNYKATLFLIKVADGTVLKEFDLGGSATAPNGLSAPAPLFNRNHELVGAYAGDLNGNLWKFSFVDSASPTTVAYSSFKLFTTNMDGSGLKNIQPIAQKPNLQIHPNGGFLVTVGTGKFTAASDKTTTDIQSVYGIWDKPGSTTTVSHSNLVQQTLTAATGGRTLSKNIIDWTSKKGWYIDLLIAGERMVGDLLFVKSQIILATTFAPLTDLCLGSGTSQLMGFNGLSGAANSTPIFGTTTNLSSVSISATLTNPTINHNKDGTMMGIVTKADGTGLGKQPIDPKVSAFRTWRQIIFKN